LGSLDRNRNLLRLYQHIDIHRGARMTMDRDREATA
jgi:hypothetical protein